MKKLSPLKPFRRTRRKQALQLGKLIKRRLERIGKSQVWLAQQLGISKQAVFQYINADTYPKKPTLTRLKAILQIEEYSNEWRPKE